MRAPTDRIEAVESMEVVEPVETGETGEIVEPGETGVAVAPACSTASTINGYAVPVDPMDGLLCESCQ